jgi:hypothetical protein
MTIIYWTNFSSPERQQKTNLIMPQPEKLYSNLFKSRINHEKSYSKCPARIEPLNNTYVLKNPFDIDVTFDDFDKPHGLKDNWFLTMPRNFENRVSANIDIGWLFFSEDDVVLEATPPYAHKTETSKYGMFPVGQFNISQWFRPIISTHILWENEKRFVAKENEAMIYVKFLTEQKVELQQFELTPKIFDIAIACAKFHEYTTPFLPLSKKYERFIQNKMHKTLLKEIKENLIQD